MNRVSVRWHVAAVDELADLWLESQHDVIERAANEIDSLLAVDPSRKGTAFALSTLDEKTVDLVAERIRDLPEALRWIRLGPLEVLFWPRELDGMVVVVLIQRRNQSNP